MSEQEPDERDPERKGYGQFCPIAIAAEIVAERWTPLVLRALFCGATRYNEIRDGVPRMSTALLSRRLKELEQAGVLMRVADEGGRGAAYRLTEAGRELFPVLEAMGFWAQKWLRREITSARNLDPDVLMWEVRRMALRSGSRVARRRVAEFKLDGAPVERRFYWLVFEPDDVDICVRDPGHPVDLWIEASLRALVEIWLGHRGLDATIADGSIRIDGAAEERAAFRDWFRLSHFARAGS